MLVGTALTEADYAAKGYASPPETEVNDAFIERFNRPEVREAGIPGAGGTMTAGDLALFYQALLSGGGGPETCGRRRHSPWRE